MSILTAGLLLAILFHLLLLLPVVLVVLFLPKSFLGEPARAVIEWMPPFLGGNQLREWAAGVAERQARKRLAGDRDAKTATLLAEEMEDAAMHAMLPLADPADLERIVPCPETGQGRIGVTVPEVLAIADHIRKHKSAAEQQHILALARENAQIIANLKPGDPLPPPCALSGRGHVCCVFGQRPLQCRPLHAITVAKEIGHSNLPPDRPPGEKPEEFAHEQLVAQGIELGLTRALKSAGLDANIYELNGALATALENADAAKRWASGEDLFQKAQLKKAVTKSHV